MTDTTRQPSNLHPGERLATYFENFFKTIVGVSTLGASLTFTKIVSTPISPWIDYGYSKTSVQYFLAISWLCFVLDLALTSFAASALSLWRPQAVSYFGMSDSTNRRTILWYATVVTLLLFGLLIAAFIFVGLVVASYVGPTGWAAVAFTVFFGAVGLGCIIWQSPIGSRSLGIEISTGQEDNLQNSGFVTYLTPEKSNTFTKLDDVVGDDESPSSNRTARGRDQYADDRFSRGSTIVRPVSECFPTYTSDRRRERASRKAYNRPDSFKGDVDEYLSQYQGADISPKVGSEYGLMPSNNGRQSLCLVDKDDGHDPGDASVYCHPTMPEPSLRDRYSGYPRGY